MQLNPPSEFTRQRAPVYDSSDVCWLMLCVLLSPLSLLLAAVYDASRFTMLGCMYVRAVCNHLARLREMNRLRRRVS